MDERPKYPHVAPKAERDDSVTIVRRFGQKRLLLGAVAGFLVVLVIASVLWPNGSDEPPANSNGSAAEKEPGEKAGADDDDDAGAAGEVALDPETLVTLDLETEAVASRAAVAPVSVTGSVESNAEREQQVVSLVSGSLASVNVSLGDRVGRGTVLATIRSPQVSELQGQFHEARTKLSLAEANVRRVRTSANRAGVIAAKAKLDLAEKTLNRQRRLLELGAGARKDVEAAEAEYKTAKAEYDYQSNVAISREIHQAEAEAEGMRATVESLRQQLSTLGATPDGRSAVVSVTAPVAGSVTKRDVNAGAAVQEGTALFTIADPSTVWVIANVPEGLVPMLRPRVPVEISAQALGNETRRGAVSYVDPTLDEETRTAKVRVELANAGERLKPGMFVEVAFQVYPRGERGDEEVGLEELWIPEAAVQRSGERAFVFVPEEDEPGHYLVKDVRLGTTSGGYVKVLEGLDEDDHVVTKGAFALKSKMLKGSFGEDNE